MFYSYVKKNGGLLYMGVVGILLSKLDWRGKQGFGAETLMVGFQSQEFFWVSKVDFCGYLLLLKQC